MAETMDPQAHVQRTIADIQATIAWLNDHEWIQGASLLFRSGLSSNDLMVSVSKVEDVVGACAYGAALITSGEFGLPGKEQTRAPLVGRAFYRIIGHDMAVYNDAEGRTKHQVIRALETVAAELAKDPSRA